MNGFAPLIEGFLAFALTMLALTMGVSSIVGALHHLRRKHARGLRDMVRLLYAREILPLLGDEGLANAVKGRKQETTVKIGAGEFVLDRTSPQIPHMREKLGADDDPGRRAAIADPAAEDNHPSPLSERAQFIYEMTFMPHPIVVEKLEEDELYWQKTLEKTEKLAGKPWYKDASHPGRVYRYWKTLRFSLDTLKDEEFRERLASSKVGTRLKEKEAWKRTNPPQADWEALVTQLLKKFQTIGGACSETFARHSRGWSMAVGFFLAFFLNVDSLDLLNSYLTHPTLRQQVIAARNDTNQFPQAAVPADRPGTTLAPARAALATATDRLGDTADDLTKTMDTFSAALNPEERQRFSQTVQTHLQNVVSQAKEVESGVGALDDDLTQTQRTIRGVTQSLTVSFPIGWKRFPNCTGESADLRCHGQRSPAAPAAAQASSWPFVATLVRWWDILGKTREVDAEGFNQWLVGVLLTGLLLGLGTPFWVQVVSGALKLSRAGAPQGDMAAAKSRAADRQAPAGATPSGNAGAPAAT